MQTTISGAQVFLSLARDHVGIEDTLGGRKKIQERGSEEEARSQYGDLVDGLSEIRAELQFSIEFVRVRVSSESALQRGSRELFYQPQVGTTQDNLNGIRYWIDLIEISSMVD